MLTGNSKLVNGYPLSDLIYPVGRSKFFTSKNMIRFWANFAKSGKPGESTNSIKWDSIVKGIEVDRKVGGIPESHMKEFLDKNI